MSLREQLKKRAAEFANVDFSEVELRVLGSLFERGHVVLLDSDARDALRRIKERRAASGRLMTNADHHDWREQQRSDAMDVVNAIFRANPGLPYDKDPL